MAAEPATKPFQASYASTPVAFGAGDRYRVFAIHTRFGTIEWMVTDTELVDELTGLPAVIRQEPTRARAVAGLCPDTSKVIDPAVVAACNRAEADIAQVGQADITGPQYCFGGVWFYTEAKANVARNKVLARTACRILGIDFFDFDVGNGTWRDRVALCAQRAAACRTGD